MAAVKALCAEGGVLARVTAARKKEMKALRRIAALKALNYSLQVGPGAAQHAPSSAL